MALAGGGAGRTSVLVFTMPFWTLLIAWPVLHERVRGSAVARRSRSRSPGLALVVEPWNWHGDLDAEAVGGAVGLRLGGRDDRDQVLTSGGTTSTC